MLGWRLTSGSEEVDLIAAWVVQGVMRASSDADHAPFGNRLLMLLLPFQIFDL